MKLGHACGAPLVSIKYRVPNFPPSTSPPNSTEFLLAVWSVAILHQPCNLPVDDIKSQKGYLVLLVNGNWLYAKGIGICFCVSFPAERDC